MRLGVWLPDHQEPAELAALARGAEASGFDSLWLGDHFLRVFGPILDPLVRLSFAAGATERVGLGTNVLVLPYRNPLVLANGAASLDALSGGRFTLGVGAGWNQEEFGALGVPFGERGRRTDEALEAMGRLWSGKPASHAGRFYPFENATLGTAPKTEGGPPVLVGGYAEAALRRAVRFGRAWGGYMDPPERVREVRGRLARLAEEAGLGAEVPEVVTTLRVRAPSSGREEEAAVRAAEDLRRLGEARADLCVLAVSPPTPEALSWVAKEVAPRAA